MDKPSVLMISNYLPCIKHNRNIWHALAERLSNQGWHIITTSSKEMRLLRLMDMLWTVYHQRDRYDLAEIDVFSGKAFIYAELCAYVLKRLNKPIILNLHGGGLPTFAQKYPKRVRHLLKIATVVVSPSQFQQKEFKVVRPDIRLIPNPINLSASIDRHRTTASPNLIWVRAFHEVYNPSMAIEVIHQLREEFPQIHLTMVGPDKRDGSLGRMKALAEALMVLDHVTIIPGVPHHEIPTLLNEADIFINTSNYDTSPRSLTEAMANGLCIVTTDVGGIPYLVNNHQEAFLVPPNQPGAMAEAVRVIITNEEIAAHLSYHARKKTEQFDWSRILPQWENLFLEVFKEPRG